MRDRISDSGGRLGGAKFIEHKHCCVEDGLQYAEFRGCNLAVVGVLHFFQQLAVVVEQPDYATLDDQLLQDANRKVGLANADIARQQETLAVSFDRLPFY